MISPFPKIFALGTDYISKIFDGEVEVTEKVDGSQFVFGKVDGEMFMRSKGVELHLDSPQKMFSKAVDFVQSIEHLLSDNTTYYCEYLNGPSHNVLVYGRVPKNNIVLFGVATKKGTKFVSKHEELTEIAEKIGIETVPLLFKGEIKDVEKLYELLEMDSFLGEVKIEGFVIKNYSQPFLLGGQPIPLMSGKYVSEKFKEVHDKGWKEKHTSGGRWGVYMSEFCTEARWQKAVQHLKEKGELENEPRDIGKLMKEINIDVESESKEEIKEFLWNEFGKDLLRRTSKGFPEWYKKQLLENSLKKDK